MEISLWLPLGARSTQRTAEEHFGGIDVLVNNPGRGWFGSIEGPDDAVVRSMFELNFAVLSATRAVLPGIRARAPGGSSTSDACRYTREILHRAPKDF